MIQVTSILKKIVRQCDLNFSFYLRGILGEERTL